MLGTKSIKELNETRTEYRGASYYILQTSVVRVFKISLIDLENSNLIHVNQNLSSLISDSSSKLSFRFIYSSKSMKGTKVVGLREEFSKYNKTREQEVFLVCEFDTTFWDFIRGFNKRVLADFEEAMNLDLLNQVFTVSDASVEDLPEKLTEFKTTSHTGPVVFRDDEQFGVT